jgi:hypothetical protein
VRRQHRGLELRLRIYRKSITYIIAAVVDIVPRPAGAHIIGVAPEPINELSAALLTLGERRASLPRCFPVAACRRVPLDP